MGDKRRYLVNKRKEVFMDTLKVTLWRLVRGAIAAAAAQTFALQVDWANPDVAVRTLVASFVTGFILALSKAARNTSENAVIQKLPV